MTTNDSKKYYWFKCNHDFFDDYRMRALQNASSATINIDEADPFVKRALVNMSIGYIYIRLLAESCTHEGMLKFDANTSYDFEVLADTLGCPVEILNAAFIKLKQLKLVEIGNDGTIVLNELNKFIGSETGAAIRKKYQREEHIGIKQVGKRGTSVGQEWDKSGTRVGQEWDKSGTRVGQEWDKCGTSVGKCPQEIRDKSTENRDKNIDVVIKGGVGETPPKEIDNCDKLKFPRERLKKLITPVKMGDVLLPEEIGDFIEYVLAKGFCEREANQVVTTAYIKSIARTWKTEGWTDKNRHKITREELNAVVAELNETRDSKISPDDVSRFWDFLAPKFIHKNGDMVTKYTVGKMISVWMDIEREKNARKASADEAQEREHSEAEAAQERWNHMILTHEDELDD